MWEQRCQDAAARQPHDEPSTSSEAAASGASPAPWPGQQPQAQPHAQAHAQAPAAGSSGAGTSAHPQGTGILRKELSGRQLQSGSKKQVPPKSLQQGVDMMPPVALIDAPKVYVTSALVHRTSPRSTAIEA